jgi:hypothetical protein
MKGARSHYDVLVLGADIPALAAGALLARRGFRVAWVRHDPRPRSYRWDDLPLRRAPEASPMLDTPAWQRIAADLSLPAFAPRRVGEGPIAQVVLPRHRIDIATDPGLLLHEFEREFPELRRPMEELFARVSACRAALDEAFSPEVPWPPDGFFERRAARKAMARARGSLSTRELLADFPEGHELRTAMHALARHAMDTDPDALDDVQLARAWGLSLAGMPFPEGGRDAVAQHLADRIAQYGGDLREKERVRRVVVERGRVIGVRFDVTDEALGCAQCITSLDAVDAHRLAEQDIPPAFADRLALAEPVYARYAVNLVLGSGGIPPGLASRALLVLDPRRPLAEENLLYTERSPTDPLGRTVLTAHALLPRAVVDEGAPYLARVRRRVVEAVGRVVPFLSRNLLAVDSPHDGLDLEDRARDLSVRVSARWSGEPEPMTPVLRRSPDTFEGLCGLPIVGPIRNLWFVNRAVIPGLGEEGALLAALRTAEWITRTDPAKLRLRREVWQKPP